MAKLRPVLAVVLLLLFSGSARGQEQWNPKTTYALLIGLTEWKDKKIDSFPKRNRKDRVLVDQLKADGVPESHLIYLEDKAATGDAIRESLTSLAKKAGPGSTILFYFNGHGSNEPDLYFANYDVDVDHLKETGFAASEISKILDENWKGDRLLLLGDSCYSGGLAKVVRHFAGTEVRAASVSSVAAENQANATWSFTEGVIKAFSGDGALDPKHTGKVTFGGLARFLDDEMRYREDQPGHSRRTATFDNGFVLRDVDPDKVLPTLPGKWQITDYADLKDGHGRFHRAQVLGLRGGLYRVRDLWTKEIVWVEENKLVRPTDHLVPVDKRVLIHSERNWWDGVVQKVRAGFALVSYDGYGKDYEQWVPSRDVRTRKEGIDAPITNVRPVSVTRSLRDLAKDAHDAFGERPTESAGLLSPLDRIGEMDRDRAIER